ncbi:MAG: hypothetical protein AAGF92_14160 [Myxococcota bacterium]
MRNKTLILVSMLATTSAACSGLGISTTPTLGSQMAGEHGVGEIWAGSYEASDLDMQLASHGQDRFHEEDWMGIASHNSSNAAKSSPRAERFIERTMYYEFTPRERAGQTTPTRQ